jgi:hypothetical protein
MKNSSSHWTGAEVANLAAPAPLGGSCSASAGPWCPALPLEGAGLPSAWSCLNAHCVAAGESSAAMTLPWPVACQFAPAKHAPERAPCHCYLLSLTLGPGSSSCFPVCASLPGTYLAGAGSAMVPCWLVLSQLGFTLPHLICSVLF